MPNELPTEASRPPMGETPQIPTFVPEVHGKGHAHQGSTSLLALELLQASFKRTQGQQQKYLDLGCGTGQFTRNELLKRCPPTARLVAVDVAIEMIQHAQDNFVHPRITHEVLDIRQDVAGFIRIHGKFDRVYSFFTLHWMKDQINAFRNVSSLLVDGGECLLLFPARTTWLNVYRRLTEKHPGKFYSQVIEDMIPTSQDIEDKTGLISYMLNILKRSNLEPQTCEVLSFEHDVPDSEALIQGQATWNPIAPLLPEKMRQEFIQDLTAEIRNLWSEETDGVPHHFSDLFLVHASKI
ncbi:acid methyltransferase, putative [Ixodes scapularis]|uniref:Acid methyltransferase, putative n=1 Tax=Ixodes scapularis TaxID=6945 RepID=B7P3L6_IXOSC|nr:acid methyltransferase, putative [Ixodes scapularis]|eukprot:XP_002404349.1 acid methyltransferase, putative [Ixodes scapularis]